MSDNQNKQNLLIQAIEDLDSSVVEQLLKDGADVNGVNSDGITPLEAAVDSSYSDMVELLLNQGADVKALDKDGKSILYIWYKTTCWGPEKHWVYTRILETLLSQGAWVTDKDLESEENPLSSIIKYGDADTARLVLDHLNNHCTASVSNILHNAAANCNSSSTLAFLLDSKRFDINEAAATGGSTPLHVAAEWDNPEAISLLLKHGADPNIVNHGGETPLLITIRDGRSWSVEMLCSYGADINVTTRNNETLLELAAKGNIFPFEQCQSIIKQIALLENQGRRVRPELYSQIQKSSGFRKYFLSCKGEIELAQNSFVDKSITFYKILTDQDAQLYTKNQNVINSLYSKCFVKRFRIYGQRICMHLIKVRPDQKELLTLFQY